MAIQNVNTVTEASDITSTDFALISKGGSGLQRVPYDVLVSSVIGDFNATTGYHNGVYRGANITKYLTDGTLWKRIAGTDGYKLFEDLYLGDYITVGNNTYVIADFDYYYRTGDTAFTQHHIVMMPNASMNIPSGTVLYGSTDTLTFINSANAGATVTSQETATAFKWNATMEAPNTNSTAGGYKYSRMRTVIMKAADTIVVNAFGADHVAKLNVLYPNPASETTSGLANNWTWFNASDWSSITRQSICDLPNETQICGQQVWGRGAAYTNVGHEIGIDKIQFALFAVSRYHANTRSAYWTRSVVSAANTALISGPGNANYVGCSNVAGVRPRFVLVG